MVFFSSCWFQQSHKTAEEIKEQLIEEEEGSKQKVEEEEEVKEEAEKVPDNVSENVDLDQPSEPTRNIEEDVIRLDEEKWPNVNGVYDAQGEWHDWNDLTYSYSYENSELIILPYTVCIINLPGQQYVKESSSN